MPMSAAERQARHRAKMKAEDRAEDNRIAMEILNNPQAPEEDRIRFICILLRVGVRPPSEILKAADTYNHWTGYDRAAMWSLICRVSGGESDINVPSGLTDSAPAPMKAMKTTESAIDSDVSPTFAEMRESQRRANGYYNQ
jgi:hypothetical protein